MIAHLALLCCLTADVPPIVHAPVIEVASRRYRKRWRPTKPVRRQAAPPIHAQAPEPEPRPLTEFEIRWNAITDKINSDQQ